MSNLGQYFTTNAILKEKVKEFILNSPTIILEPCIGQGDLIEHITNHMQVTFDMYEIDPTIPLLNKINKNNVIYTDFITQHIPKTYKTNGFGIYTYSLYPITPSQPSGSINMSLFNNISINQSFNIVDRNYNNYIFKAYFVTHNILRIYHGVGGLVFSNNL